MKYKRSLGVSLKLFLCLRATLIVVSFRSLERHLPDTGTEAHSLEFRKKENIDHVNSGIRLFVAY